jgi:hypothetical protein
MAVVLNPQEQQDENQQQQQTGAGGEAPTIGSAPQATNAPPAQQRQGSGRYTNLQKYIQANQGAGERLGSGISQQMTRTFQPGQKQAETQAEKIGQNIQQGKETLARGTGYGEQMKQQDFNAQQFVGDQNRLQDFTKFRFGQNVDEAVLGAQKQGLDVAAQQQLAKTQARAGQIGSEQGRFGLLQEAFGGRGVTRPQYSSGQQRLDQLFLQAGGGDNVQKLQNVVRGQQGQVQGLQQKSGVLGQDIGQLAGQEKTLQEQLTSQAQGLESGYIQGLEGQVGGVNAAREAEREKYRKFFNTLTGKAPGQTLDEDLFSNAGLELGQQTYNVLNDPNLTLEQIADISARNAQSYRDVAQQKDVDYYKALAQLSKGGLGAQGQFVGPQESDLLLTKAGDLDAAAKFKTNEDALSARLARARENFIKEAMGTTLTGVGRESYSGGLFGGSGESTEYAYGNVGDLISKANEQFVGGSRVSSPGVSDISGAASNAIMNNLPASALLTGGLGGPTTGALLGAVSGISSILGGGDSAGAERAARAKARQNLEDQIFSYLQQKGYGNVLTTGGAKDTSQLSQQQVGLEREYQRRLKENQAALDRIMGTGNQFSVGGAADTLDAAISGKYNDISKMMSSGGMETTIGASASKELADQARGALASNDINQLTSYANTLKSQIPKRQELQYDWATQSYKNVMVPDTSSPQARIAAVAENKARLLGAEGKAGIQGGYETQKKTLQQQLQELINPNVWQSQNIKMMPGK